MYNQMLYLQVCSIRSKHFRSATWLAQWFFHNVKNVCPKYHFKVLFSFLPRLKSKIWASSSPKMAPSWVILTSFYLKLKIIFQKIFLSEFYLQIIRNKDKFPKGQTAKNFEIFLEIVIKHFKMMLESNHLIINSFY